MSGFVPVTDDALARARSDLEFRQRLCRTNLDRLLFALHKAQRANAQTDPKRAREIREGALLAARLADLIRELEHKRSKA